MSAVLTDLDPSEEHDEGEVDGDSQESCYYANKDRLPGHIDHA